MRKEPKIINNDNRIDVRNIKITFASIVSFFIPFVALYYQYDGLLGTMGITIAFILILITIFSGKTLCINKPFALFSLFYIIRLLANLFLGYGGTTTWLYLREIILIMLVAISALVFAKQINEDLLFRVWSVIGIIVSLMVFYQSFQIYVLKQSATPFIIGYLNERIGNWGDITNITRPSACFSEPGCVADFIAPLLIMALNRKKILLSIVLSVSTLLTTSTNGLVTVILLWGLFIVLDKEMSGVKRICIIAITTILVFIVIALPIFSATLLKLTNELSGTSNSYVRIQFGFETFSKMSFIEKIFGIPDYSIQVFRMSGRVSNHVINTLMYGYANGASMVMIRTGLIGTILWIMTLVQLFRKLRKEYIPFFITFLVMMFTNSNFYNPLSIVSYIFILFVQQNDETYRFRLKV